jgi:hypothetical protein
MYTVGRVLLLAPIELRDQGSTVPWQESLRIYRIEGGEKKMTQTKRPGYVSEYDARFPITA